MKAITCSQCGALIKGISMQKKVVVCKYCGSEMFLKNFQEKVIEIPDKDADKVKTKTDWEIYLERHREMRERSEIIQSETSFDYDFQGWKILGVIVVIASVIGFAVLMYHTFNPSARTRNERVEKISNEPTPMPTPTSTPEPCPNIDVLSYSSYVFRDDEEKDIAVPIFKDSDLPTCDIVNLRRGMFNDRNKMVKVRVTVDTEGNVVKAEQIAGHKNFKRSAEEAALKSTYYKPKRRTNKTIVYYYLLMK